MISTKAEARSEEDSLSGATSEQKLDPSSPRQGEPLGRIRQNHLQIIDLEVLCLLKMQPMSGYGLKKGITEFFDYDISFGTLYPHLRSLEGSKLISGRWVSKTPRKRMYSITEKGRERLVESAKELGALLELITTGPPGEEI